MGVFQGNFGNANGAATFTSDIGSSTRLATSAPFAKYLQEAIWQTSAFVQSGILGLDSRMNNTVGSRIELPFFNSLDYTEETIDSSATWGSNGAGYFTTQKTSAGTQYSSITYRGFAYAADDLSGYQTGEDALAHVRDQMAEAMNQKLTSKLVSQLTGLLGPGGPLAATNALDKSVTTGAAEANYLNAANVTEAKYLLSDRADNLTSIAMHPKVAAYLDQIGMLTFSTSALSTGGAIQWGGGGVGVSSTAVKKFAGLTVVSDSQLPIRGTSGEQEQFVCYLFSPNVVRTGQQFGLNIESDRNILALQDTLAVSYSNLMHIIGTSWSAAGDNPSNAALATAGNWSLAYDPQLVEVVELVVNSPFGGTVA